MNELVVILLLGILLSMVMYIQTMRAERKQLYSEIEAEGEVYMQRLKKERTGKQQINEHYPSNG